MAFDDSEARDRWGMWTAGAAAAHMEKAAKHREMANANGENAIGRFHRQQASAEEAQAHSLLHNPEDTVRSMGKPLDKKSAEKLYEGLRARGYDVKYEQVKTKIDGKTVTRFAVSPSNPGEHGLGGGIPRPLPSYK